MPLGSLAEKLKDGALFEYHWLWVECVDEVTLGRAWAGGIRGAVEVDRSVDLGL